MHYPLDAELAAALSMTPDVDLSDVSAARAAQARELAAAPQADSSGVDIVEFAVPGPDGAAELTVWTYRPQGVSGPLPALYSIHGGGFMLGSPAVDHDSNLRFCRELKALVVSVDYRLAPEHAFPASLEDCYAGLCWLAKNSVELAVAADRIALWGDSAGAGLATGVALLARDRGGPEICFQFLNSPCLDDRLTTASATAYTDTPVWDRRCAELSWRAYLGPGVPGTAQVSYLAAPGRASTAELIGLPPAYVVVMQFDPLRDEGIDYARTLLAAGVPTELHLFPGTFHGAAMVPHALVVQRMTTEAITVLRRALGR